MQQGPPASAAIAQVLLEPGSAGRDLLKLALKELLLRGVFRLRRSQETGWFGRQREVLRVELRQAEPCRDAATGALARELRRAAAVDPRLDRTIRELRTKFGSGYERFREDEVLAGMQAQGLYEWNTRKLLGLIPLRRGGLTAKGRAQALALKRQIERAQRLPPQTGAEQLAPLLAALGPAVVLVPTLWPGLRALDGALRPAPGDGMAYEFDFSGDDLDALDQASDAVDASVDAGDGGDGGDGGGD